MILLTKTHQTNINHLQNNETITKELDGEELVIDSSMVDIRVSNKEGYDVAMENNHFIILNTERTEELILEGIAREFVSKIQNLRKTSGFNVVDRITINYKGTEMFNKALSLFENYIKDETLAIEISFNDNVVEQLDINGEKVKVKIERIEM